MPKDYTAKYIVRKSEVDESKTTPAKDDAADQIEEYWGIPLSDIAEQSGYSRQHIKNALDDYFDLFDSRDDAPQEANVIKPTSQQVSQNGGTAPQPPGNFDIEIPPDTHADSYMAGYHLGAKVEDLDSFMRGALKRKMQNYGGQ